MPTQFLKPTAPLRASRAFWRTPNRIALLLVVEFCVGLRLGMIGCGGIATFALAPALCIGDDIEIAYLYDLDVSRACSTISKKSKGRSN